MKILLSILLLLFFSINICKSNINDRNISLSIGTGYSIGLYSLHTQFQNEIKKDGVFFSSKLLLQSENYLALGVESGYFNLSRLNTSEYKADQNGIPLLLLVSHKVSDLRFNVGIGYFYLFSRITGEGKASKSNEFDFGYSFSAEYNYKISNNLHLSPELKYFNITEYSKSLFMVSLNLSYILADLN